MSPGVRRGLTVLAVKRMVGRFGEFHPATFAAYGRAHVAWEGRIKPPRLPEGVSMAPLASAYTTAQLRAYGNAGLDNRTERKAKTWASI